MSERMNEKVILVVEDETPLANAIKIKLEENCCKVVTARDSKQAISYLEELDHVDAIWLDHYLMGEETGYDILVSVKSEGSKWKNIPVFLVTNTAAEDKVHEYLELGVNKYFVKSGASLSDIIEEIKKAIAG